LKVVELMMARVMMMKTKKMRKKRRMKIKME
jgi:hypothetical protein